MDAGMQESTKLTDMASNSVLHRLLDRRAGRAVDLIGLDQDGTSALAGIRFREIERDCADENVTLNYQVP